MYHVLKEKRLKKPNTMLPNNHVQPSTTTPDNYSLDALKNGPLSRCKRLSFNLDTLPPLTPIRQRIVLIMGVMWLKTMPFLCFHNSHGTRMIMVCRSFCMLNGACDGHHPLGTKRHQHNPIHLMQVVAYLVSYPVLVTPHTCKCNQILYDQ